MDWLQILDRWGVPLGILVVLWRWARPKLDRITDAHIAHVQASTSAGHVHAEANRKNSESLAVIATAVDRDAHALESMSKSMQLFVDVMNKSSNSEGPQHAPREGPGKEEAH